jgi:hypothetical protein
MYTSFVFATLKRATWLFETCSRSLCLSIVNLLVWLILSLSHTHTHTRTHAHTHKHAHTHTHTRLMHELWIIKTNKAYFVPLKFTGINKNAWGRKQWQLYKVNYIPYQNFAGYSKYNGMLEMRRYARMKTFTWHILWLLSSCVSGNTSTNCKSRQSTGWDMRSQNRKTTNTNCHRSEGHNVFRRKRSILLYPFSVHVVTFSFITNLMHLFN